MIRAAVRKEDQEMHRPLHPHQMRDGMNDQRRQNRLWQICHVGIVVDIPSSVRCHVRMLWNPLRLDRLWRYKGNHLQKKASLAQLRKRSQ